MQNRTDLKKDIQVKFSELRAKRKGIIANFRKKIEEARIEQIKNSIFKK